MTTSTPVSSKTSTPFLVQSAISFGVSSLAISLGIAYLNVNPWVRAFLALGLLYVITSTFTLAKCVRDRLESEEVVNRVDKARLDKLLAEHDPFRVEGM